MSKAAAASNSDAKLKNRYITRKTLLYPRILLDRIVFEKMNYNPVVSVKRFPELNKFYKNCARKVADFCKINHIDCYIIS
ncbi:MAG: hypothetical protein M1409_08525 [Actinobacteria bacterium]|nr:hypothetical protein [Actinomycetota bacterium]